MAEGDDNKLPRGLVSQSGTPAGKSTRLPSIRAPRDLTLGGVKKKQFVPNLNLPVKKEKKEEFKPEERKKEKRQRPDRGRGRGGRGRGRGEVIQSHSIFEEGPGEGRRPRFHGIDNYERPQSSGSRSVSIKREKSTGKDVGDILNEVLKDDFVVNDKLETEDFTLQPIKLPVNIVKHEVKQEDVKPLLKVKQEPGKANGEESMDVSPESEAAVSVASQPMGPASQVHTCADLFMSKIKSDAGELLFIQLPDTLPGDPPCKDDHLRKKKAGPAKEEPEEEKEEKDPEDAIAERLGLCSLADLGEGFVGKLQIHRSGRTRLVFGNCALDVAMGTTAGFLQELVSIKVDGESGDMCVLGNVQHKLICTPDFESLLS